MRVAFVSGPYRAETIAETVANIREAEAVAVGLWQFGFAAICPHLNTALLDGHCSDEVWLKGDLEILRRCDLAVFFGGWRRSEGALAEFDCAGELGIPRYDWVRDCQAIRRAA